MLSIEHCRASARVRAPHAAAVQGEAPLMVEQRSALGASFGHGGTKVQMQFGQLLDRFAEGDESLYLTTQEVRWGNCMGDAKERYLPCCCFATGRHQHLHAWMLTDVLRICIPWC